MRALRYSHLWQRYGRGPLNLTYEEQTSFNLRDAPMAKTICQIYITQKPI